jgi:hypothetical protein
VLERVADGYGLAMTCSSMGQQSIQGDFRVSVSQEKIDSGQILRHFGKHCEQPGFKETGRQGVTMDWEL